MSDNPPNKTKMSDDPLNKAKMSDDPPNMTKMSTNERTQAISNVIYYTQQTTEKDFRMGTVGR